MAIQSLKAFIRSFTAWQNGGAYDLFGRGKTWGAGHVLRVEPDMTITSAPRVRFVTVASTDADITNAKGAGFSQIFNTWDRISYDRGNPHSIPSEESAWTFDATTGLIQCTVNSSSFVGFVGPDYYDNYEMEVVLSSTSADDDNIGLILGYIEEGGVAYMLEVQRAAGSTLNTNIPYYFNIVAHSAAAEWTVAGTNGSMHYPDGTPFPSTPAVTNNGNGGWDTLGPISLKIKRTPTSITVASSDKGAVSVYTPENTLTIDLTSDDRLTRYIHPCRIGYLAQSQPASSYQVLTQPDFQAPIFDVRDGSMQVYEGGLWKTYAAGSDYVKDQIPRGIVVSSIANNTVWYATSDGVLRKVYG